MAMNNYLKYALIFAGGLTVGALASGAVKSGSLNIKPLAATVIGAGLDVKDAISCAVEKIKENAEDLVAEARADQAVRKAAADMKAAESEQKPEAAEATAQA